ncbi:MAG: hypothetical protein ACOYUZ_05590 [Patescibacteria group bacterium]
MHSNHVYNLMNQLVQEHKSLWRIKKDYAKDAGSCKQCKSFWKKMIQDKEDHIKELTVMIKGHLK